MDEPPLYCSDSEASIAVPEQSIRIDIAVVVLEDPVPDDPRGVRVLGDVERGIQHEAANAACRENDQHDGNSSHYRLSSGRPCAFPVEGSSSRLGHQTPAVPACDPSSSCFGTLN